MNAQENTLKDRDKAKNKQIKHVLRIDYKLPTLNEYINKERRNKYIAAKLKNDTENKLIWILKSQIKEIQGLSDLDIFWETSTNRVDADNIFFATKFLLDAVVKAGILKSDGRKHVNNISHKILTTGRDHLTVIIKESTLDKEAWQSIV